MEAALVKGAICPFANYYQFFREATFAFAKQGSFILLHDSRNPAFLRSADDRNDQGGLWPFLYEAIPQNLRHRAGRLTIQMVVEAIQAHVTARMSNPEPTPGRPPKKGTGAP